MPFEIDDELCLQIWFVTEPLVIFLGRPAKLSMFSGGLLMYIAYDLTHYFLHFGTPTNEMSRKLKVCLCNEKLSMYFRTSLLTTLHSCGFEVS